MADGFDIHLDKTLAQRLQSVAEASGLSATDYALAVLGQALSDDWTEDMRRFEEYERTGEAIPAHEALAKFKEDMDARLAALK